MNRKAIVLSQGDELTTGQITDKNASFLCSRLWDLGFEVIEIRVIQDKIETISAAITQAAESAEIVIMSGGLGPTEDDLTSEAVANAFGMKRKRSQLAERQITEHYKKRAKKVTERSMTMAKLPEGAEILKNEVGSAPGFFIKRKNCQLFFLPGVPVEMKKMFNSHIPDKISESKDFQLVQLGTIGIGESAIADRLKDIARKNVSVGYLASRKVNIVKLRFSGAEPDMNIVEQTMECLKDVLIGREKTDLGKLTGEILAERGETISLAESCTAGKVSAWLAATPGSSRYLLEGSVVYSNEAKIRNCGVPAETIERHGAVSESVALKLAEGIRKKANTDWGIGITGIAGPGGGSKEKPVGTVHMAVSGKNGTTHRKHLFWGTRDQITDSAAAHSLFLLLKALQKKTPD